MSYFLMIPVIIIAVLVLFSGHWFIYKTITRFFDLTNQTFLFYLKIALAILGLAIIVSFVLGSAYNGAFIRAIYTISFSWVGILFYLILAAGLCWLALGISNMLSFSFNTGILAGFLFALAFATSFYGIINAATLRVTTISVKLPNLPAYWQGKTAVWVSDSHLGQIWSQGTAQKTADTIAALHPDILFIGGDLYDGVADGLKQLAAPFAKIAPAQGIYFITGNHEEFSSPDKYLVAVKSNGIRVLDNQMITLNGLQIIGVDYTDANNRQKFTSILDGLAIDPAKPSILLKHAPFDLDISQKAGVSFQISGHTHKGQIFPISLLTKLIYNGYDYGLKKFGNMIVYTSSGAGTWGPPLKVDAISEIVQIKFQ